MPRTTMLLLPPRCTRPGRTRWLPLLLCAALPAYALEQPEGELPAGEISVEELPDLPPIVAVPAEPSTPTPPAAKPFTSVVLKGLNKVTARTLTLTSNLGTVVRFGNLEIIPHRCVEHTVHGARDVAVLLEIWELKPDASPERLFQGWMFGGNQALSALEHPVYDVWLEQCLVREVKE